MPFLTFYTTELKRRSAYAFDFWIRLIGPPLMQVLVSYFVWQAVYSGSGKDILGGYSFNQIILYQIIASMVFQMVQPEVGVVLMELYQGQLTKYLVYPVSYISVCISRFYAFMTFGLGQIIIVVLLLPLINVETVSIKNLLLGSIISILSGTLFFLFASCIEFIGFWVEAAWGLVIMLQFLVSFLGGRMVPLTMFPEQAQFYVKLLPFHLLVDFPVRVFLGRVEHSEFVFSTLLLLIWITISFCALKLIWKKGSYHYSGVGM